MGNNSEQTMKNTLNNKRNNITKTIKNTLNNTNHIIMKTIKPLFLEQNKQYARDNKEYRNETIICDICGCQVNRNCIARHQKLRNVNHI